MDVRVKCIPLISSDGWLQSWTFTGIAYLYGFVHSVLKLPVLWISELILMSSAWHAITYRPESNWINMESVCLDFYIKTNWHANMKYRHHSVSLMLLLQLVDLVFLFTYPGVSSLLKFLCNGLIRGHDNKHLDGHVEDGHGDQVGNIVSMEKNMIGGSLLKIPSLGQRT